MIVYVVHGCSGTCPSDSDDWICGVYASKDDADAYAAAHDRGNGAGSYGGPWYTVAEHVVLAPGESYSGDEWGNPRP